jgi:hypothetical protein
MNAPIRILLIAVGILVTPMLGRSAERDYKKEFHLSLTSEPDGRLGWNYFGPEAEQFIKFEPAGVHVTLPAGGGDGGRPATGVGLPIVVKGNFEITVAYEILGEPNVFQAGPGQTRITLDAVLDRSGTWQQSNVATLSRRVVGWRKQFFAWLRLWDENSNQHRQEGREFPATANSGKLRLVRTGSDIAYYVADGPDAEFKLLHQTMFGSEDLRAVQFNAATGGPAAALEVRLTDLVIQADGLENVPGGKPIGTLLFAGLTIGGLAVGLLVYAHRSRASEATAERADVTRSPAVPRRLPIFAVALVAVGIYAGSIWANYSFAVKDGRDLRYIPPFIPYAGGTNMNEHLGAEYFHIAQALAAGRGFADPFPGRSGPTAWMPPILPAIEAVMLRTFDNNRDSVMGGIVFLQVTVLILTGILVMAVAQRTGGVIGAWTAAIVFLAAVASDFHAWFQFTHDCFLVLFALDLLVAGLLWLRPAAGWMAATGWGLIGGFVAIVSPIVGFVWGVMTLLTTRRATLKPLLISAAVAAVVLTPWTVRNYRIFGRLIPVKSNAAYELYQSQCLQADGLIRRSTFDTHPNSGGGRERLEYQNLGEMAFLDQKMQQFKDAVSADPQNFLDRMADRLFAATVRYVPFNEDDPTRRPWAYFVSRVVYPLPFLAAVFLVVSAAWRRLHPMQWAVLGVYFFYLLPYVVVSFYQRYAAPLLVVNALLMIWAIDRLVSLFVDKQPAAEPAAVRERPRRVPVMTSAILLAIGVMAMASPTASADEPAALRVDFRGKPVDKKLFQLFGLKDQIKTETEGLRITLPGPNGESADTGVQARFRVKGDFQITTSFELINAPTPVNAWCVGVHLHARFDDPAETSPFVGRYNRQDGNWFTCDLGKFDENHRRDIKEWQFPSEAKAGRLRMTRRAGTITYSTAEAGSDDFHDLCDRDVGTADIRILRLQAENKRSDAPLDVRFLDLEILSGDSFSASGKPLLGEKIRWTRGWLVGAEISVLAVLVLLLALWRRQRRKRRAVATPTEAQA